MGRIKLKNVCEKDGRLYFRKKSQGKEFLKRLPAFDDPKFAEEYHRLSAPEQIKPRQKAGTIGALIAEYRAAGEYRTIKSDKTRRNTTYYLRLIEEAHGHRTVSGCKRADVKKMRDQYAEKQGTADNWLAVFRKLMTFAVDSEWRDDNPALGISLLGTGEYEPWPTEVLNDALEHASPMMKLAIVTGLCSGARVSDVIRMQHNWHDGHIMQFVTSKAVGREKKGVAVAVPMHPIWLAAIDLIPRVGATLLYGRSGNRFSSTEPISLG